MYIEVEDDDECIVVSTDDSEITLTEDGIGNLFKHFLRGKDK